MSDQMRGGYKVNATNYNKQKELKRRYRQTPAGRAETEFKIFVIIFLIVGTFIIA